MKKELSRKIQIELGKKVKSYRLERNMSQMDLALKTDTDIRQIQRVETGDIATSIALAYLISKALDISMNELFDFNII